MYEAEYTEYAILRDCHHPANYSEYDEVTTDINFALAKARGLAKNRCLGYKVVRVETTTIFNCKGD
jgi:hypothetical protein